MNPHNKDEFAAAWAEMDDPRAMEQALTDDQQALEGREVYRSPDGLYFEVARKLPCGTVVTDAGLWLSPEEFSQCRRYV